MKCHKAGLIRALKNAQWLLFFLHYWVMISDILIFKVIHILMMTFLVVLVFFLKGWAVKWARI